MSVISAARNVLTGRGHPIVTGTMQTAEVKRLDGFLNEVPTREEWQSLRSAGIFKIHGTYRSPHYMLEAVGDSRPCGSGHETIYADRNSHTSASVYEDQQPSRDIDLRSVDGGDVIARVLGDIHGRALSQGIGDAS